MSYKEQLSYHRDKRDRSHGIKKQYHHLCSMRAFQNMTNWHPEKGYENRDLRKKTSKELWDMANSAWWSFG